MEQFIIVAFNPYGPAQSTRFVMSPNGKFAFKYAGVNEHQWSKFDDKDEAEQTAQFMRQNPKYKNYTFVVEGI